MNVAMNTSMGLLMEISVSIIWSDLHPNTAMKLL